MTNLKSLMMNKQVLLAMGMIVFAGAVLAAGTGAFFSSQAEATGNVFTAGTLDLKIAKDSNGNPVNGWLDAQNNSWNLTSLTPGGTPEESAVWLKNTGSVDGMTLGVAMANAAATVPGTAAQMRITEMTLDGDSLLEGGAGADFGDYSTPMGCDETITPGNFASTVNAATAGQVLCVEAGDYNPGDLTMSADGVTLVALNAPNSADRAKVDGTFNVTGDNVTIKGLYIEPGTVVFQGSAISINADGVTIDSNIINDVDGLANGGSVKGVYIGHTGVAGTRSNVTVTNNVISDIDAKTGPFISGGNPASGKGAYGVLVNFGGSTTGLVITNNTISDLEGLWSHAVGLEGDTPSAVVTYNDISDVVDHKGGTDSVSVFFETNTSAGTVDVKFNNFDPSNLSVAVHPSLTYAGSMDARNNWWGDFDSSDQVFKNGNNINTNNPAGGPIAGLINGNDFNGNGYADLQDLNNDPILSAGVGLDAGEQKQFVMAVQLDGPTTGNEFQSASLTTDLVFTLNQI
ncbi:hypothetical protein COU14_01210 [Candidatus Kaiserbacteria bacterium CG10_big_fil_rev_8_21_14_0_10_44_10]|uniref:Right handed beta helix domain-containing protein n=1 Tax=Candidatus Kaiserbacteria bacterium CG10_big_fil_rev_8_21_14_0_10_44_10 TaxID=1974606 RepID=A0A2H0UHX0_9BACT|nr:MAG: hypothetical protein COU14_01210 [Candidatus Kaiserbacteria bacterium CG10_big_fil_rev_8_21_14_0_10_44_10]